MRNQVRKAAAGLRESCTAASIGWGLSVVAVFVVGCASAPTPKPVTPPYSPKFSYQVTPTKNKLDVTLGVVAPQFGEAAKTASVTVPGSLAEGPWSDPLAKDFVSGVRTGFETLLSGKGFNVTGPFESLEDMTFPQKKGADLVIYPEIDAIIPLAVQRTSLVQKGNSLTGYYLEATCEGSVSAKGNILIIAMEPLSGEKMWTKRVELSGAAAETIAYTERGEHCQNAPQESTDARARLMERTYAALMTALDDYVNGEEFQQLKVQASDLRQRKAY